MFSFNYIKNILMNSFNLFIIQSFHNTCNFQSKNTFIKYSNIKKYKNVYHAAFRILNSRLHVDNLIQSLKDIDLTFNIQEQIKLIFGETGFNIRKWKMNVQSLQDPFKGEGTTNQHYIDMILMKFLFKAFKLMKLFSCGNNC